jgi:hypothetical protein
MRRRQLKRLARAGNPTCFITLTSNPASNQSPDERAQQLSRAWRLIVKRAKRRFHLTSLPYLTVIEATKRGEPHLHILARVRWLPQKWLSEQSAELLDAPVVWIERINIGHKVAAYVAKYIGKAPHKFQGVKRYWRSLDWIYDRPAWDEANRKVPGIWRTANYSLQVAAFLLTKAGFAIEQTRQGHIRGTPDGRAIDEACWLRLFGWKVPGT